VTSSEESRLKKRGGFAGVRAGALRRKEGNIPIQFKVGYPSHYEQGVARKPGEAISRAGIWSPESEDDREEPKKRVLKGEKGFHQEGSS